MKKNFFPFYTKFIIFSLLIILFNQKLISQTDQNQTFRYNGSLNLSSEFYNVNNIPARQPNNTQRLIFRSNITLFNQIDIPIEINLSNSDSRFLQPFNQFGISPKITDWLTLHGGYFYANLSDFTFGDIKLYGGGIELSPGNFKIKAYYGRSKVANEPDSVKFFSGVYNQTAFGFMLGYGNESSSYVNLNFLHTIDDSASIKRLSFTESPSENLVTSLAFGVKIIDELIINAEIAASAYSSDITAKKITNINVPEFLFTPRISSQVDGAAKLNISIDPKSFWSLRLGTKWIGPGYVTQGYTQMTNDLLEFTIDPTLRLLENRLNIRSSIGIRSNNLRNNRISTTNRFLGLLSCDYQITNYFGFNLQYNNNQIKATQYADSIKISNVLNFISIAPRFNFDEFGGINNVMLTYSYQNSEDSNPYYNSSTKNITNTLNLIHSIYFPSSLNLNTSILYNNVTLSNLDLSILSINETIGHQFFENKLALYLNLGYSSIKTINSNDLFLLGIRATYNLNIYGSISLFITNNNFNSNDPISPSYNEIQGNLQYLINF